MRLRNVFSLLAASAIVMVTVPSASQEAANPEIPMTGLKIRIETSVLDESVAFYTQHLGMQVLDSWDDQGDRGVILGLGPSVQGEAFLELAHAEAAETYDGLSLQFRVGDLDAVVERLRGQVEFRGPKERPWGSTYLYLEDPMGVEVIVYQGKL